MNVPHHIDCRRGMLLYEKDRANQNEKQHFLKQNNNTNKDTCNITLHYIATTHTGKCTG